MRALFTSKWTKVVLFLVCLIPLGGLTWRALDHGLGANPVEFIQLTTGRWTLRFLVFTLCITPFRKLLNLPDLIRFRRMLGLFAFFYAWLALPHLSWPGSIFRSGCHVERCRQASIHHSRVSRVSALGTTGHFFDGRLDSQSRWEALADTASRHLFCGDCRCDSFLLESKIRRTLATLLRFARCNPALVEIG
jgi:hypothetical protein